MKVRNYLAIIAVLGLTAGLTACTSDAPPKIQVATHFAAGTTMARLHDAGTMTIATRFDQPLFGLAPAEGADKTPAGFDVEIGKLIASKLGIAGDKITWVQATSDNRDALIAEKKADLVIAGDLINDESKQKVAFAGPYYTQGQDLLVATGNPGGIHGPQDLRGKTVCTIAGSSYGTVISQYAVTLSGAPSAAECLPGVSDGSITAVTADDVTLAALVVTNPDKFEVLGNPFTAYSAGIAVAHDDDKFRSFVNDVLEQSFGDGTWKKLWDSTAGTVLGGSHPPLVNRY
ncbi:glutamate ABC transporter substrate-binding protein [Parafrigoribacterium mesophilum]|uniref:transporter substrate-binding domain-containing protein n=1 Tax=Parafrigoribacterium mesophilum TaxID=433646 RepID=UPI0031FCA665